MAINFCTIDGETVDGFCGLQRAKVLSRLVAEKYTAPPRPTRPPIGGSIGMPVQPNYGFTNPWYDPYSSNLQPNVEQPNITVRVRDLFGDQGEETLYATTQTELVTVTNLEFQSLEPTTVTITDLTFENVSVNIRDLEI